MIRAAGGSRDRAVPAARAERIRKNAGLGFAIPYLQKGQPHDYVPDFVVRIKGDGAGYLILETKGFDELADVTAAAAQRWCAAVNADGQCGRWRYAMARSIPQVSTILDGLVAGTTG